MAAGALVLGVGPIAGLGSALARRFAKEGLAVTLAARSGERLERTVAAIREQGGSAQAVTADATRPSDLATLVERAEALAPLELVVYNIGNNKPAPFLETAPADFELLWRQNALGGFLTAQAVLGPFLARSRGTLIFTGATASLRSRPPFTAFAAAKFALRALAQGLAREFGPQGIHVAHVVIDGVIDGEKAAEGFPEYLAGKGPDGLLRPEDIAEVYWQLHRQAGSAWSHEVDLRPFKEPF